MTDQLLNNTCFHEINDIKTIPDGFDRIVSLNDTVATMHTRLANADADAFEPKIINGARLFLITSYNGEVVDAATVIKAKADERETIAVGDDAGDDDAGNEDPSIRAARAKLIAQKARENLANMPDTLEGLDEDVKAASINPTVGGKRTRRRKNHGSKRRNASNKSGRRASKQSRRRGKKQSKRHGRK